MPRPAGGPCPAGATVLRWLLALAAMLAFAGQAMVVQGHFHAAAAPAMAADAKGTHAAYRLAPAGPRGDEPADCPICRLAAHGGSVLLPGVPALPAPAPAAAWLPVALLPCLRCRPRSHAWHSRDPPASLRKP